MVEKWEKEFNKLMDTTKTTNAKLYYMTEVRYDFFQTCCQKLQVFPVVWYIISYQLNSSFQYTKTWSDLTREARL